MFQGCSDGHKAMERNSLTPNQLQELFTKAPTVKIAVSLECFEVFRALSTVLESIVSCLGSARFLSCTALVTLFLNRPSI